MTRASAALGALFLLSSACDSGPAIQDSPPTMLREGMVVHLDEHGRPIVPTPQPGGTAAQVERRALEPRVEPAPGGGDMVILEPGRKAR